MAYSSYGRQSIPGWVLYFRKIVSCGINYSIISGQKGLNKAYCTTIAQIKSLILNIMNAYRPVGLIQVGLGWFGSVGV